MSSDLISRQAAFDEISKQQTYKMFEGEDTVYFDANDVGSVLVSLPSAQPELAQNLHTTCTDAISRQAAFEAIHEDADWLAAQGSDWQVERMERDKSILKSLPSTEPEQLEKCPIYGGVCLHPSDQCYECPRHAGAERKTGKWIDKSGGIDGAWNYCSVCGEQAIDLYDYCPNCGAKMER